MIIDTSALIAILPGEPEAEPFAPAIAEAPGRLVGAFTALETAIVIEAKKGDLGGRELDLRMNRAKIEIVPLTSAIHVAGTTREPALLRKSLNFRTIPENRTAHPFFHQQIEYHSKTPFAAALRTSRNRTAPGMR